MNFFFERATNNRDDLIVIDVEENRISTPKGGYKTTSPCTLRFIQYDMTALTPAMKTDVMRFLSNLPSPNALEFSFMNTRLITDIVGLVQWPNVKRIKLLFSKGNAGNECARAIQDHLPNVETLQLFSLALPDVCGKTLKAISSQGSIKYIETDEKTLCQVPSLITSQHLQHLTVHTCTSLNYSRFKPLMRSLAGMPFHEDLHVTIKVSTRSTRPCIEWSDGEMLEMEKALNDNYSLKLDVDTDTYYDPVVELFQNYTKRNVGQTILKDVSTARDLWIETLSSVSNHMSCLYCLLRLHPGRIVRREDAKANGKKKRAVLTSTTKEAKNQRVA